MPGNYLRVGELFILNCGVQIPTRSFNNNKSKTGEMNTTKFTCGFQRAWAEKCQTPVDKTGDHCPCHTWDCVSCGEPATRDCPDTGQFVCGCPICDNCEHTTTLKNDRIHHIHRIKQEKQ